MKIPLLILTFFTVEINADAQTSDSLYVPLSSNMIHVKKKSLNISTDATPGFDSLNQYLFRFAAVNRFYNNEPEQVNAFNKLWKVKTLQLRINGKFFTGYLKIAVRYSIARPGNVRRNGENIYIWFFNHGRFEKEQIIPDKIDQVELS